MGCSQSTRIYKRNDELKSIGQVNDKTSMVERNSLSHFPGFLKALEKSNTLVIACYNARGQLDHISPNAYKLLGYDPTAKAETLKHPTAPHQGAVYYRQHTNGSVVQFHNTFLSKSDTGEVYTIDQPMNGVRTSSSMTLVINRKGDIKFCEGCEAFEQNKDGDIIGKNLFQLCQTGNAACLSDAMASTTYGKCYYNLYSTFIVGTRKHEVTLDFHPCVNNQVVVCVSLVHSNLTSVGTLQRRDSGTTALTDGESPRVDNASPSENELYFLGRRLRDMSAEIQHLQDFRDNALLPMYSIDITGIIVWANDAMINMMGYGDARNEYIGSITFKYHVDQELVKKMVEIVLGGKTLNDFECNIIHRDGHIMNVTYNSNAKFDSNGTFSHSRCIVQNMTERNRLRRDMDEMEKKKQLAEMNEQKALTASHTKSDFLAVMSHEIRTPINGVIGAASLLSTTALNDDQLDYVNTISDSADILLSLISNILDISKIESGKFQLDRVSMRFVDLVRKCTDMLKNQAAERGLSLVATIGEELDDPGVWHHGDPTRLNQVLLNFLSNALKFTHTGGVECKLIKISAEDSKLGGLVGHDGGRSEGGVSANSSRRTRDDTSLSFNSSGPSSRQKRNSGFASAIGEDEDSVSSVRMPVNKKSSSAVDVIRLEVTDTGVGIEDCSKLFSDFVQASSSVHKKYGGTGLGLSISKKIIHLMHGEVGMSSTVGEGTTVWAEIPLRRAHVPRKGPAFVPSPLTESIKPKRAFSRSVSQCSEVGRGSADDVAKSVRILIAEDNKVNQKVLKRLLETLGYTNIDVAWNGQEAVEAVKDSWEKFLEDPRAGRYDIVLMDCLMPVMDGWEATAAIRAYEEESMAKATALSADSHPTIVLALTANATEKDKQRCADCGMDAFYVKPIARDGLNAMMLHWVSKLFADADSSSSQDNTPRRVLNEEEEE